MRILPLVVTGALVAAGAAAPASAATKKKPKPITKTHQATAAAPDPTNHLNEVQPGYSVCAQRVPQSFQTFTFKAPAIGKLNVKLTGFTGDWDVLILDSKGSEIGYGGNGELNTPQDPTVGNENTTVKIKKAKTTYSLVACNWAGGNTATLTYTFTYA